MIGNLNKIGINQVGIVGMDGVGKTQLVVEFVYRFSYAFDCVYRIQAADTEWYSQFVELARDSLQLPISDPQKGISWLLPWHAITEYLYLQIFCRWVQVCAKRNTVLPS